jgi:N-formylglutamate deformylase
MDLFSLSAPASDERPVLVEVPHAGLAVPESVASELVVARDQLMRDADVYVDKLYAGAPSAGASLLVAHVSRYVVDLNRAPDDIEAETVPDHPDPRGVQPRGVVWRVTTEGRPALAHPLTYSALLDRLARFHAPYHNALDRELVRKQKKFGHAILIAAHSMPSSPRTGGAAIRADVVPGTRGRTSADPRIIDLVDRFFRDAGLSVRHDDPYRGGWTTARCGRPSEHLHAIQIELNRALYVDENNGRPKDGDFEKLSALLTELVRRLGAIALR